MTLKQGTLWRSLVATTGYALHCGSLLPIPTNHSFIEDGGMRFFVRVLSSLRRKDEERKKQSAGSTTGGKTVNPFLPPEKDLTLADITDTHRAVLNKFNVVEHHLLIVTRRFEDQDTLLTPKDFEALWLCMAEYNSLGFYNGGREAGASQKHKHLQVVPLPLAPEGPAIPIEPLLVGAGAPGELCAVPAFPFLHSFARLDKDLVNAPLDAAKKSFVLYSGMLQGVGMEAASATRPKRQSGPYCLLVTREWMLLVPRSRECFDNISLNALAFAGSLFVRDEEQLERLKSFGPMKALASVAAQRVTTPPG